MLLINLLLFLLTSCVQQTKKPAQAGETTFKIPEKNTLPEEWKNYWYAGLAEISSYELKQARYGQIHSGNSIIVFVTEDLSARKLIKLDDPYSAGSDKLPVLKMNQMKNFNTGIYPYQLMLSVFQPVQYAALAMPVKTTCTVNEWCGIAFLQYNLRNNNYEVTGRSYFEKEGDQQLQLPAVYLEDGIWNTIRLSPSALPVGKVSMIAGSFFTRLAHLPLKATDAECKLYQSEDGMNHYSVIMKEWNRHLEIHFQSTFPYSIVGWTETYPDLNGTMMRTEANLLKTIRNAYWTEHFNEDRALREELLLPKDY